MKRFIVLSVLLNIVCYVMAQPEPFPVDKTFSPDSSYMQKQWYGEYNGVDPMSKARLSIKRTLCLYTDMTFTNTTYGTIQSGTFTSEEMLLKSENGVYTYDASASSVTYTLDSDSALDMNAYLKQSTIKYTVNKYTSTNTSNTYSETTQFTYATDGVRHWVVQDSKLGSDQQQGMPAVYVMSATELPTNVQKTVVLTSNISNNQTYDLFGRKITGTIQGKTIIIRNGQKIFVK